MRGGGPGAQPWSGRTGLEAGQPSEAEEARLAGILIARLAREARHLKKQKKRHLLPGGGEQPPGPEAVVPVEAGENRAGQGQGMGPQAVPGSAALPNMRHFFTVNLQERPLGHPHSMPVEHQAW